jgi:hypothetical protein
LTIKPYIIDMTKLLDNNSLHKGLIVSEVMPSDISIKERVKERTNVIQITTGETLLMWDIQNQEEVSTLVGYD